MQAFFFPENRLEDSLHEMAKTIFWEKQEKNKLLSAEWAQRVVKLNTYHAMG